MQHLSTWVDARYLKLLRRIDGCASLVFSVGGGRIPLVRFATNSKFTENDVAASSFFTHFREHSHALCDRYSGKRRCSDLYTPSSSSS